MIVCVLICLLVLIFVCFLYGNSKADKKAREEEPMVATCEKCKETFTWYENDALVKYGYGKKYVVHCPHCDRLTVVLREQ